LLNASINVLPKDHFDVAAIRHLLEEDLAAAVPSYDNFLAMVISVGQFRRNWAPDLPRPACARPSPTFFEEGQPDGNPSGSAA